jgi:hypothetical protein
MELNNPNPSVTPSENPVQTQPVSQSISNKKSNLPIILGMLILLIAVGAGSYYLGTQKNSSTNQPLNTITQTQPSPTESKAFTSPTSTNVSWKTESVQIKKESAVSGNETINLTFQLPSNWTLKTVALENNTNNMIKSCADYVLMSNDGTSKLTVSPLCAGWSATYSDWPQSAVSIKEEANVGADHHTAYTIRFLDSGTNQYKYVEGEKGTSDKIMDAILITYNSSTGNFLPTKITLSTTDTNTEAILAITDKIVSTIKAQLL